MIVKNIHISSSHVLVHCSDGWDRTAQLTSLAQVCLDPYYRTLEGFQVLVEKDWCSFGYKFMDRCGHLSNDRNFVALSATNAAANTFVNVQNKLYNNKHIRETSPIFQQFLDCVFQVMHQNPTSFEFNEYFLTRLHYHVYSCQFGTFLSNCEKDRRRYRTTADNKLSSVWDYFNSEIKQYLNPSYDSSISRARGDDKDVLFPDPKAVKYWAKLFGKTDAELNAIDESPIPSSLPTGRTTPEGSSHLDPLTSNDKESAVQQRLEFDSDPSPGPSSHTTTKPLPTVKTNNTRGSVPSSPRLAAETDNLDSKLPALSGAAGAFGGVLMDSIKVFAVGMRDSWYSKTTGPGSSFSDDPLQVRDVRPSSAGPQHGTLSRSNSNRQRPTAGEELTSILAGVHGRSATPSPKHSLAELTLQQEISRGVPRSGTRSPPPPNGSSSPSTLSFPSPIRAVPKANILVARSDSPLHGSPLHDSPLHDAPGKSTPRVPSPDQTTTLPTSRSAEATDAEAADQSVPELQETFNEPAKDLPHPLYIVD